VQGNLHAVFFRTLTAADVISITLQRQDGTPIPNTSIRFDTRKDSTGNRLAGAPLSKQTAAATGTADFALLPGTYPVLISQPVSTARIGGLNDTITLAGSAAKIYQTSQQNWVVQAPSRFTTLNIDIYQTDASGNLNRGTSLRELEPLVLSSSVTATTSPVGVLGVNFTTELFKGTYRAVITLIPANPNAPMAPYITPANAVISAQGDGLTDTVPTINFGALAGNMLKLTLKDGATPISSATTSHNVFVFDKASQILIGAGANDTLGAANILTGDITDIVAVVTRVTNTVTGVETVEAIKTYTASSTSLETLVKYPVSGNVAPPAGGTLDAADATMQVAAKTTPGLGIEFFDKTIQGTIAGSVSSLGVIQNLKLFEGPYSLTARINKFPESDKLSLTIAGAAPASQTINVRSGGLITGRIQDDQTHVDIANASLLAVDTTTKDEFGPVLTNAQGTYTLSVPLGTYDLFVNGAVTRNFAVNAATVTKNFTRFTVNGRLVDSLNTGLAGSVQWSGGQTGVAPNPAVTNVGTFTLKIMEGDNWVVFIPPASQPSIAAVLEPAVLIDASTITTN
jgi:hypothetical protein